MILLAILNTFLPAVGIAAAVWIAQRILRVSAATQHWVWWSVLAAAIALPLWPGPQAPGQRGMAVPSAPVEVPTETSWLVDALAWAVAAWAAFALYRFARIAFSYAMLRRLRSRARIADCIRVDELRAECGVKRPVQLLVSAEIASPIAIGFLQPAILLPETLLANLAPAELDHVFLHELAHIARRDDWTNLAGRLAGAVFGLHPVVAFSLAQIGKQRERACDDWVVAATGEARSYAASLTRVFELSRGYREHVLASGIAGSRLGDRVEQLLTQGRRFTRDASIATLIVMAVALMSAVSVASRSPAFVALAQEPIALPAPPDPPAAPEPPAAPPAPPASAAPAPPSPPKTPAVPVPNAILIQIEKLAQVQVTLHQQQKQLDTQSELLQRQVERIAAARQQLEQERALVEKLLKEILERLPEK